MGLPSAAPVLLLIALAFAGCAGGDDPEPSETTGPSSSTGPGGSSSETTTEPSANQPPTGSLGVSVTGSNATFTLTGSDPDNDTLAWSLDLGDGATANGTMFPATVNHTYAAPGNYSANVTITDGQDPVYFDVNVTITGGAAEGESTGQTFQGEWTASWTFGCAVVGIYPAEDVTHSIMVVDATTFGKEFVATFTSTTPNLEGYGISFQDGSGGEIDYVQGASPLTGEVLEGTVEIWFYACDGGAHEVDYIAG